MNREEKAALIEEIGAEIESSEAIFAVDYLPGPGRRISRFHGIRRLIRIRRRSRIRRRDHPRLMRSGGAARRGVLAAAFCTAALVFTACGGDDSTDQPSGQNAADAKAVLALGSQLQAGYESKDAKAVCALMEPASLKKAFKSEKACVAQLNSAFSQTDTVPDFSFDQVTVDGDTAVATAEVSDQSSGNKINFKKVNGKWFVDLDPDASQPPTPPSADAGL